MIPTIVWFRGKDLRVGDHAPLKDAIADGEVFPLFVIDPYFFSPERAREAPHRVQYLLDALAELSASLAALGSRLTLVPGRSVEVVPKVSALLGGARVVAQRWVEPFARERDRRVREALGDRFTLYEGETLLAPGSVRTQGGGPYSVYTPFSRACRRELERAHATPIPAPGMIPTAKAPRGLHTCALPTLAELGLTRNPRVLEGGESRARGRLERFLRERLTDYEGGRDRMDVEGTSRLSADLKFGAVSIREVWSRAAAARDSAASDRARDSADKFMSELLWREFTHHTLWDHPTLLSRPFRADFEGFPWRDDPAGLAAWKEGATGYPIVDAAARQLVLEGYVHNRARMIAASFLTKHLLVDYRAGEAHYLRLLTDGDWAQNNAGWQWSAGCGCDAAPYFRVFNPVSQGERFDPSGEYIRRYLPQLARLPPAHVHAPWAAPEEVRQAAGVILGKTYPRPIVDHKLARERYLAAARTHLKRS